MVFHCYFVMHFFNSVWSLAFFHVFSIHLKIFLVIVCLYTLPILKFALFVLISKMYILKGLDPYLTLCSKEFSQRVAFWLCFLIIFFIQVFSFYVFKLSVFYFKISRVCVVCSFPFSEFSCWFQMSIFPEEDWYWFLRLPPQSCWYLDWNGFQVIDPLEKLHNFTIGGRDGTSPCFESSLL